MDVCLVNMPFASVMIPSIGLGILQATLDSAGIATSSVYANLLYFQQVGLERFQMIRTTKSEDGLGDWLFGHSAFPDFKPDHHSYIRLLTQRNYLLQAHDPGPFAEMLFSLREESDRFTRNLAEQLLASKPRIVGCTSTVQQHVPSLALLRAIRESAPDVITLMGGPNCESIMGQSTHRNFPWVDFVVSGEADGLIVGLTRAILDSGRDVAKRDLPEGVFAPIHRATGYPEGLNGGTTGLRATGKPLAEQAIPNYDDYFAAVKDSRLLGKKIIPGIPIQTARGCWWGRKRPCTFCGLNGHRKGFYSKSAAQVLREMDILSKRYGSNGFETVDNIMDMRYYKTLLPELIRAGSPYRIFYETKSNLNRRQVELLRRAGITWIQPGIESLHTAVLSLMNKGCNSLHNVRLLKWCRQYGIRVAWNILHDFPGEDDAWYSEMAQRVPLLTHLQPPSIILPIRFDRFSHYHARKDDYGLKLHPAPLSRYLYPLSETQLAEQVYAFEDGAKEALLENPLLALLLVRTGLNALRRGVLSWVSGWIDNRPTLEMVASPTALQISDTRPAAAARHFSLTGLEREIYLSCEDGRRMEKIVADHENTREEAQRAVQSLLDRKLAIVLDDHLLSLAVWSPCPDVPEMKDFPGGTLLTPGEESN